MQGEARFPNSARPGQRDKPNSLLLQEAGNGGHLALAADQRGEWYRHR